MLYRGNLDKFSVSVTPTVAISPEKVQIEEYKKYVQLQKPNCLNLCFNCFKSTDNIFQPGPLTNEVYFSPT